MIAFNQSVLAEARRLRLEDGDILVIRMPEGVTRATDELREALFEMIPKGTSVLFLPSGFRFEHLTSESLRRIGYARQSRGNRKT